VTREPGERVAGAGIDAALAAVARRGPDGCRVETGPGYGFGHARLAIVDLGAQAAQPMWDEGRRHALLYNGEVFDHADLRTKLRGLGHRFRTSGDTEVVLHALAEWGRAALPRLHGQFALAWYDRREHCLLLARDPLGICPLVWWRAPDAILFASQPSAIVAHPAFRATLNVRAVSSFLSYRQVLGGETFFEGLFEVEPGTCVEFRDGGMRRHRYWSLAGVRAKRVRHDELRARVRAAVRRQLRADVPVALLLSGGLDSTILAAEAARSDPTLVAYTAGFADRACDESGPAGRAAAALGIQHRRVPVTLDDHEEHLARLVTAKGAPPGMHNEVETHVVAKALSCEAKVVLCGEGADELFAGYGRIFRLPFEMATARGAARSSPFEEFTARYTYLPLTEKVALFDPAVWREADDDALPRAVLRQAFTALGPSFFDAIWSVFVQVHLRGLLAMLDGTTMAAGVEARVPFLDAAVIDAARGLPVRDKIRWHRPWSPLLARGRSSDEYSERLDTTKYLLRRAYRDMLPAEALHRRKQGFPVPLADWYGGRNLARVRSIVLGRDARLPDLLRRQALEAFLQRAAGRGEAGGRQLFQLVSLETFLRTSF